MTDGTTPLGVLRDYPLRLWQQQQQYDEDLLREFQLLVLGQEHDDRHATPRRLVELADHTTTAFAPLITAVNAEREQALAQGLDRVDSYVPLLPELPSLLAQVQEVLSAADEFCRSGDLLILPRPDDLARMMDWVLSELQAQAAGAEPTPWPGPF